MELWIHVIHLKIIDDLKSLSQFKIYWIFIEKGFITGLLLLIKTNNSLKELLIVVDKQF